MPCSKCETTAQAIYLLIPRSSFGYLTYCIPCAMEHQRDAMIQPHHGSPYYIPITCGKFNCLQEADKRNLFYKAVPEG